VKSAATPACHNSRRLGGRLGNRYARRMMLKHRRTRWTDGSNAANDYSVVDERGEKIGRIYRILAVGGGHAWHWRVFGTAVKSRPPAGQAPTREAAQAAFKVAWATCQPRERGA
jgi:hypothetical protein